MEGANPSHRLKKIGGRICELKHWGEEGSAMVKRACVFSIAALCLCLFLTTNPLNAQGKGGRTMAITVTSPVFGEGEMIPRQYTCDGKDISPPLSWSGLPEEAKSIALICDDPDAPMGTWVHWVLFNLPGNADGLPEDVPASKTLDNGARHGKNDFQRFGYGGPCPPGGTHRYYFKVYALDTVLEHEPGITKAGLLKAMESHILAEGQLMGRYQR
jgi:Raf kinase inhibitor-like YbhB/YbcL family protein